jgi:tripartite-type tricarboxylate transporter receptor subunit TctC
VLDKLNAALVAAIKDPQFKDSLAKLGAEAVSVDRATPESLAKHLKAEIEKWGPIIKKAGVYAD